LWMRKNSVTMNPVDIGGMKTPMLVKFFRYDGNQFMEMYVSVKEW